jgi:hypothetical protein
MIIMYYKTYTPITVWGIATGAMLTGIASDKQRLND